MLTAYCLPRQFSFVRTPRDVVCKDGMRRGNCARKIVLLWNNNGYRDAQNHSRDFDCRTHTLHGHKLRLFILWEAQFPGIVRTNCCAG